MAAVVENQQTAPRALLVEALPARQEEDSSGLEAGSAKEPAASLLWTEVDEHEEPPLTLSPPTCQAWGKGHGAAAPQGGHLGTARGTKEGIHNCFESPRALGPLKSPRKLMTSKEQAGIRASSTLPPRQRPARGEGGAGSWHQHPGRAHCGRVTTEWVLLHTCVHARRSRVHACTLTGVYSGARICAGPHL